MCMPVLSCQPWYVHGGQRELSGVSMWLPGIKLRLPDCISSMFLWRHLSSPAFTFYFETVFPRLAFRLLCVVQAGLGPFLRLLLSARVISMHLQAIFLF